VILTSVKHNALARPFEIIVGGLNVFEPVCEY